MRARVLTLPQIVIPGTHAVTRAARVGFDSEGRRAVAVEGVEPGAQIDLGPVVAQAQVVREHLLRQVALITDWLEAMELGDEDGPRIVRPPAGLRLDALDAGPLGPRRVS